MAAISRCLGLTLALLLAVTSHLAPAHAGPATRTVVDAAGTIGDPGPAKLLFEQVDDTTDDDDSTVDVGPAVRPWCGVSIRSVAWRRSVDTRGATPQVASRAVPARGPPA